MMKAKSTVALQLLHSVGIKSLYEDDKEENLSATLSVVLLTSVCYTVSVLSGSGQLFAFCNSVMKSIQLLQGVDFFVRKGNVLIIKT